MIYLRTYIYNSLKPKETVPVQKVSLITAIIVLKSLSILQVLSPLALIVI